MHLEYIITLETKNYIKQSTQMKTSHSTPISNISRVVQSNLKIWVS